MSGPRTVGVVLILMVLFSAGFSAAPSNVAGLVYSESYTEAAPAGIRGSSERKILLREDATYIVLIQFSTGSISGVTTHSSYSLPPNGTWRYLKTSERTAVLTLDRTEKVMTFANDTMGQVASAPPVMATNFSLIPYEPFPPVRNCSNRSYIKAGGSVFTGFVTSSLGETRVLVRAIGPGLAQFGVADAIRQPVITLRRADSNAVRATNSGWSNAAVIVEANRRTGAFPLASDSRDAALVYPIEFGAYIVEVASADPLESGQVLIEVYVLP